MIHVTMHELNQKIFKEKKYGFDRVTGCCQYYNNGRRCGIGRMLTKEDRAKIRNSMGYDKWSACEFVLNLERVFREVGDGCEYSYQELILIQDWHDDQALYAEDRKSLPEYLEPLTNKSCLAAAAKKRAAKSLLRRWEMEEVGLTE